MLLRRLKTVRIALRNADPAAAASRKSPVAAASPSWGALPAPTGPHSASRLRLRSEGRADRELSTTFLPILHIQPENLGPRLTTGHALPTRYELIRIQSHENSHRNSCESCPAHHTPVCSLRVPERLRKAGAELQQARAQAAAEQSQIAKMQQEQKWVVAGDVLFPEGGYQLTANGKQALNQYVPRLQTLQNAKVVVYGYTDNLPVGPALQWAGIGNNIDLSSRRADNVVAYLQSQGVNPNIISAKGFGDTHAVAPNDTADGRAQNRRIEIVMEGPGA